jgi:hypothetical protein
VKILIIAAAGSLMLPAAAAAGWRQDRSAERAVHDKITARVIYDDWDIRVECRQFTRTQWSCEWDGQSGPSTANHCLAFGTATAIKKRSKWRVRYTDREGGCTPSGSTKPDDVDVNP